MEAGPELDALVAEKVMGWNWNIRNGVCYAEHHCFNSADLWPRFEPSTNIAAAWEVVEKFKAKRWSFFLEADQFNPKPKYMAQFYFGDEDDFSNGSEAATAPLAICLAALKVVDDSKS